MNRTEIIKHICKREGKKVATPIGNVREIYKIMCLMFAKNPESMATMFTDGLKQLRKK